MEEYLVSVTKVVFGVVEDVFAISHSQLFVPYIL